jgi:hypothetical protein
MSNTSEVFQITGDRPRRLTRSSTKETRENWFRVFDASELERLKRATPKLPIEPVAPEPKKNAELAFPLLAILLIVGLGVSIFATSLKPWLVLSHLLSSVTLFIFSKKRSRTELRPPQFTANRLFLISISSAVLALGAFIYLQFAEGKMGVPIAADIVTILLMMRFGVYPWTRERQDVKEFNAAHEHLSREYDRRKSARESAVDSIEQIKRQIEALSVECLHYEEMVRSRRELFDGLLEEAFAELGVSEEIQHQVLVDRDRNILEIAGPWVVDNSEYGRPVVQFKYGVLPRLQDDAPILAEFLSHLYSYRVAIILPQGLGTYDAVVDSVNLTHRSLGNQLTMWKSISRVNRENGTAGWADDKVVLETYGGTRTDLEINGVTIKENLELIPVVDITGEMESTDLPPLQGRVVNSFVLAIQQKMTE